MKYKANHLQSINRYPYPYCKMKWLAKIFVKTDSIINCNNKKKNSFSALSQLHPLFSKAIAEQLIYLKNTLPNVSASIVFEKD